VVAPPPCPQTTSTVPFVAEDFTAPADSVCITITVTDTSTLVEGSTVQISTGSYLLQSIISLTEIEICNEGEGLAPGTIVVAEDSGGNLQYPVVTLTGNIIEEETDGATDTINSGNLEVTTTITLTLVNPSIISPMVVMYSLTGLSDGSALDTNTGEFEVETDFEITIDGGTPFTAVSIGNTFFGATDDPYPYAQMICYDGTLSVAAGATSTIVVVMTDRWNGDATASYNSTIVARGTAIGVVG